MTREQIEQSIYESETVTDLDLDFSGFFSEKDNKKRRQKVNEMSTHTKSR